MTAIALGPAFPGGLGIAIGVLSAAAAAGLIGGISGWCKMKWGTNEMISSFLLSGAMTLVIDYLITGPFMDSQANLLTTSKIPQGMWLSRILKPSSLSTAIIVAVAAAAAVHIWMFWTKSGFKLRMMGQSYRFRRLQRLQHQAPYMAPDVRIRGVAWSRRSPCGVWNIPRLPQRVSHWNGLERTRRCSAGRLQSSACDSRRCFLLMD